MAVAIASNHHACLVTTRGHRSNKIDNLTLLLTDGHSIPPTAFARKLGFIFDYHLSF